MKFVRGLSALVPAIEASTTPMTFERGLRVGRISFGCGNPQPLSQSALLDSLTIRNSVSARSVLLLAQILGNGGMRPLGR